MQNGCADDSYHVNMIINLLIRFPEIFTVTYNLSGASYCLSFMVRGKVDQEQYLNLRHRLKENLEAYCYFKKIEPCRIKLNKRFYGGFTQLETNLANAQQVGEEISLITRLLKDTFGKNLVSELRPEDIDLEDGSSSWEEMMSLFTHRHDHEAVNKLFAFREAGKVYVFDQ